MKAIGMPGPSRFRLQSPLAKPWEACPGTGLCAERSELGRQRGVGPPVLGRGREGRSGSAEHGAGVSVARGSLT